MKNVSLFIMVAMFAAAACATILDFNMAGMGDAWHLYSYQDGENYYGNKVYLPPGGTRLDWVNDGSGWVEVTSTYAEADTPNIQILYWSGGQTEWFSSDIYGDLVNWVYDDSTGEAGTGYICAFQPEPGYQVVIESFDVAHYESGDETANIQIISYNASDGEIVEWQSGDTTISGTTHTTFTPNFTGTDPGSEYWIGFDSGTSGVYYYGFDNIAFSQIPPPDDPGTIDPNAVLASNPRPTNGETGVGLDTQLRWDAGVSPAYGRAIEHHVYIGTDESAVADADTSSPEYKDTVTEVGPSAPTPVTVLNPSFETSVLADDSFIAREPNDWDAWVGGIHYVYNPPGDGSGSFDSAVPDGDNAVQVGDLVVDPTVSGFYQYVPVPGGLQAGEIYTMSAKHAGLSSGFQPLKVGIDFCASISLAEYWQPTMLVTNYDERAADDRDWKEFSAVLNVDDLGAVGLAGITAGFSAGLAGWPEVDPSFYDDVTITVSTDFDPEYDPTLLNETEYFWRIDEVYDTGSGTAIRKGSVWSFTTPKCGQPGQYYDQSDLNQDCYTDLGDLALVAAAWLDCRDPANSACAPWDGP